MANKAYNKKSQSSKNKLTQEIAKALKQVKQIQKGKLKPLTLKDI